MTANPLLEPSTLPNKAPPFNRIEEAHYKPAVEAAIAEARSNIDTIKNNKAPADFENTIVAMESASETLGEVTSVFYNQLSAVGGDGLHALAEQIGPITSNFSSDIIMDAALFARVKAVYDAHETLKLTPEQQTLLRETYKDFVRGGALLPDDKKARLRAINEELSVLGPVFMNNANKSAEAFEMLLTDEADLSGLPESARIGMRQAAADKGHAQGWLVNLDMPSYIPFMQYADKRELRETIWRAYASRAYGDSFDNCETVLKTVRLKHERAQLLGYATHAHFVLEERMAEKPERVLEFLKKLKTAYKPAAQEDLKRLQHFAQQKHGLSDLKPWDVGYYSEKLKEELFKFSSEDLRPYFPLDKVLSGTFTHFSKLFGLTFEASNAYPAWHADVQSFDVKDAKTGNFIGTLYADFYPRTGKKDGAWKTSYRSQGLFRGKIERPVIAIVCNFTKPASGRPSLLTHGEVLTLFHEMGHAIHGLLSDVTYRSLSGTSVLWDFVELPSQVQENWCYERETLDLLSGHFETGEKIPETLIKKLRDSMNFMVGWAGLRQVNLATLDMAWHAGDPSAITDVAAFEDKVTADTSLFPRLAGPTSVSFGHIFGGGYSAGYYSYKWAEVLDADTFELFLEKGLYDQTTAHAYRAEILARGGSEHPNVLYRRFRGRDADPDALLRREGLLGKKAA